MAHFTPRAEKRDAQGSLVVLYTDDHAAWFVGRKGDPSLDPHPMGAFRSEEAAKNWADHKFDGGSWGAPGSAPAKSP